MLFTEGELSRAEFRAKQNPEDLTKRNWWVRMVEWFRG